MNFLLKIQNTATPGMDTMEDLGSSRNKKGRFILKKTQEDGSLVCSLLSPDSGALAAAADTPTILPQVSFAQKKKRRRSDEYTLVNKNFYDERYRPETLKYEGEHHSLVNRNLNPGVPLKRVKRVWDDESPTTSAKYPGEARVCAGAVMRTSADGSREGVTLPLFSYTGKTVVDCWPYCICQGQGRRACASKILKGLLGSDWRRLHRTLAGHVGGGA